MAILLYDWDYEYFKEITGNFKVFKCMNDNFLVALNVPYHGHYLFVLCILLKYYIQTETKVPLLFRPEKKKRHKIRGTL